MDLFFQRAGNQSTPKVVDWLFTSAESYGAGFTTAKFDEAGCFAFFPLTSVSCLLPSVFCLLPLWTCPGIAKSEAADEAGFLIIFLFQRTYAYLPNLKLGLFFIFSPGFCLLCSVFCVLCSAVRTCPGIAKSEAGLALFFQICLAVAGTATDDPQHCYGLTEYCVF